MTNCTKETLNFTSLGRRNITANFDGGHITSDAGSLLLREIDHHLGLTDAAAKCIPDDRQQSKVKHSVTNMLKQRVYGLCLGYEDLNDHNNLRNDIALQTACSTDLALASSSTLCRYESKSSRKMLFDIHKVIFEQFIQSFKSVPYELVLDFDATDSTIYGNQQGRFYQGYYGDYCFLPLYVFCQDQLLISYLRPANQDPALHAWAILSLLVKGIRKHFPNTKIVFRGDCGFCRHKIFNWCEKHSVDYIVGLPKNKRLEHQFDLLNSAAEYSYKYTNKKSRMFSEGYYQAGSWKRKRRVIAKCEYTEKGSNFRLIVTSLRNDPQRLYDHKYCARGDMENRIKEQQLGLFADRTSASLWWSNQFRLLLSGLAYILLNALRKTCLNKTILQKAYVSTIRNKLLKVAAVVIRNTRSIKLFISSAYPYKKYFTKIANHFVPT